MSDRSSSLTGRRVLRVALYGRVSSEQQAERQTIASQVAALKERVAADGLTVESESCFFDDGYSGSNLQRPALERLRDRSYAGEIDRLYVHSPDRLARKYAYQVLLLEELQRHSVEVVFLNRAIGVSPEEDLLLQMQGMIAEYERAKIVERSRRGKRHAARSGRVAVLSGAPYGYRFLGKHQGGGCAVYEVMPEHARVVQQIFSWIGYERLSIGEVCRRLQAQNVASPKGKPYWDRTTVWGILKNPAYHGQAAFGKTRVGERRPQLRTTRQQARAKSRSHSTYDTPESERIAIPVPALVDEALFAMVQEQLAENRRQNRQRKRGARYLLQGLLECGCCGYAYYGKPTSRKSAKGRVPYTYYRCVGTDAYRFGGTRICENRQVRTDPLDDAVWHDVQQLLRNPAELRQEFERRRQSSDADPSLRVQLDKQIAHQQRAVNRLIDAYENGILDRNEFEPRLSKAKERLKHLRQNVADLDQERSQAEDMAHATANLEAFATLIADNLTSADWSTRREIIRALVKSVKLEKGQVRITYRINPRPFELGPFGGRLQHCWRSAHRALRRPHIRRRPFAILRHSGLEPFLQQPKHAAIRDPVLQKRHQPFVADGVEEAPNVRIDDPVHLSRLDSYVECIQGLMLAPSRTEPVT